MADTATLPNTPALPERKIFTGADVEAMIRAGVVEDGGPEELLDGELWVHGELRRFCQDEVDALYAAGILGADESVELLDGGIWDMPSEGALHGNLAVWLNRRLVLGAPVGAAVACERTMRLAPDHRPEPDFCLYPASLRIEEVRGPDILLLIEILDTSRQKDLVVKSAKYRDYGVREYWVIDLEARVTHVHHLDGDWPEVPGVAFDAPLAPRFAPGLTITIAESGL